MATTRFIDHLLEGDHASRPAAGDVPEGTLYSCTTHSLVYQSDGTSTWSTWATLGGGTPDLDAVIAASSGQDIADALSGAAAPDAGNVFATMADVGGGGGWPMLEAHTATSSATLDFTSFFSSTYDDYMIELVNVIPATNATGLFMRVGTGGGPTYDTGSNYLAGGYRQAPAGNAANVNCGGTSIGLDVSGTISNSSSGSGLSGTVMLYNGNAGTVKPNGYGHTSVFDGSTIVYSMFGWQYTQTTSLTALRFLQGSGNIASGTIRIYGIPKV